MMKPKILVVFGTAAAIAVFFVVLFTCAKESARSAAPGTTSSIFAMAEQAERTPALQPPAPPHMAKEASGMFSMRDGPKVANDREEGSGRESSIPGDAVVEAPARKVHYNGYLKLKVSNPKQSIQQATELVEEYGGFVEMLNGSSATLRVPVARFREIMGRLASYGDVLARSMTAQDVTDAYLAADLRSKTLKASRERLIALLAASRDANEKLRLLQEIKRLTQQIDQLDMQLTTLASLADFSRLTVEFEARSRQVQSATQEPIAGFRWIHQLSPFRRDVAFAGRKLDLKVPEGFVALSNPQHFVAESADGAVIWTGTLFNKPVGSTEFWLAAIKQRLAPEFASAEQLSIGSFKVLRLIDQSDQAYRYLVGVQVQGDQLRLVEIYYPSAEQESRYQEAVTTALQGGQA